MFIFDASRGGGRRQLRQLAKRKSAYISGALANERAVQCPTSVFDRKNAYFLSASIDAHDDLAPDGHYMDVMRVHCLKSHRMTHREQDYAILKDREIKGKS
ncbi:MAG: hypothetical protein C0485_13120 [Pirellula sp.]|nr:hypothetical protein [Pirellula sp.]